MKTQSICLSFLWRQEPQITYLSVELNAKKVRFYWCTVLLPEQISWKINLLNDINNNPIWKGSWISWGTFWQCQNIAKFTNRVRRELHVLQETYSYSTYITFSVMECLENKKMYGTTAHSFLTDRWSEKSC